MLVYFFPSLIWKTSSLIHRTTVKLIVQRDVEFCKDIKHTMFFGIGERITLKSTARCALDEKHDPICFCVHQDVCKDATKFLSTWALATAGLGPVQRIESKMATQVEYGQPCSAGNGSRAVDPLGGPSVG